MGYCCFSQAAKEATRIAYDSPWRILGGLGRDKLAAMASLLATIARVVDPSVMFFLERGVSSKYVVGSWDGAEKGVMNDGKNKVFCFFLTILTGLKEGEVVVG